MEPSDEADSSSKTQKSSVADAVAKYGQRLHRLLAARLQNPADTEGLAEEGILRLLGVERFEQVRSPGAPG